MDRPVVLVVEDEPSLRLLCRINLELEGFDVHEAASLAEARAELAAWAPCVVLLDLTIGHENGSDLMGELTAPVALVTGAAAVDPAVAARADAFLRKPFAIDELVSTVRALAAR